MIAISSDSPTAVSPGASSPFSHTRHVARTASKSGPYRVAAAETTSSTVAPSTTSEPVPALTRAWANNLSVGTR